MLGRAGREETLTGACIVFSSSSDQVKTKYNTQNMSDPFERQRVLNSYHYLYRSLADKESCLLQNILKYFSEDVLPCGHNCTNCRNDSELIDVTYIAKYLISALADSKKCDNMHIITDIVKGSSEARLLNKFNSSTLLEFGSYNQLHGYNARILSLIQVIIA